MSKRRQVIEIFAPTEGRRHDAPTTFISERAQPDGRDAKMYYGVNQKEYGTSLFATGTNITLGSGVSLLFNARFTNGNSLQVFSTASVLKYSEAADTFVSDGQSFTGSYNDPWNAVMYNSQLFYTNGVDLIQVKQTISGTGTVMASATNVATYKAFALSAFNEHLNLYHVFEGATEYANRVRWTKKGALTLTAATTDFGSGTAGALDLPDTEGEIKTSVPLGQVQAVYAERSIHIQSWVGGDEVYRFQKAVSGIGTPSRRGAVAWGDVNYFIGQDSFYIYRGGNDYEDIGATVKQKAFAELNNAQIENAYVEYDPRENEVWFHIPVGTDTIPSVVWAYRLENKSWSRLVRSHPASGTFIRQKDLTIGELQGNIGDLSFNYNDYALRSQSEVKLYVDPSGRVVKKDPSVYSLSIDGTVTAQSFVYDTPDLVGLSPAGARITDPYDKDKIDYTTTQKRWTGFTFEAVGTGTANVLYSINKGASYTAFPESPVTLSATGTLHQLDLDVSSEFIRYRITNTAANEYIGVTYAKVEFTPGSEVN